jgi:hypothetical protein
MREVVSVNRVLEVEVDASTEAILDALFQDNMPPFHIANEAEYNFAKSQMNHPRLNDLQKDALKAAVEKYEARRW